MKDMTPYQRCLAVIEGRVPDRIPGYTPTVACDVASKILGRQVTTGGPSLWYAEAKAWLAGKEAFAEFEHRLLEDRLEIHRLLGNDIWRFPWRKHLRPSVGVDDTTFIIGDPDGVHQVWRWEETVSNFIEAKNTARKPEPEDWPEMARRQQKGLAERAARAKESAGASEEAVQKRVGEDFMVVAGGGGISLGYNEPALLACIMEPGAVGDILDGSLEVALAQMEGIAGRGIKVVFGGGDMADKNGPAYSPKVFRELMLPRLKKLAARCRELGLHYVWRTDGKLWPVTDMLFVEAGFPGYGEVDRDADMDLGRIRAKYPDLVVWTNVSADLLNRGTRQEVYDNSIQILEESDGRGYLHGCSNAILPGTPVENVLAMTEARMDWTERRT
jgi:uroporphyrinogen decarboxylase